MPRPTVGTSSSSVDTVVQVRPPKIGTKNAKNRRNVPPASPGAAASQNICAVLKRNPACGSVTTTTLHTIHTANESVSAVADTARLRRATREPSRAQNARSSGSQWASGAAIAVTASSGRHARGQAS